MKVKPMLAPSGQQRQSVNDLLLQKPSGSRPRYLKPLNHQMQSSSQSQQSQHQEPPSTIFPQCVQKSCKNPDLAALLPELFEHCLQQAFVIIDRQGFKNEVQLSKALKLKEEQRLEKEREEQRKKRA